MVLVNRKVIQQKINIIEDNLIKMEILARLTEEDFLEKFYYIDSAKHLLQVSIEVMLDIANHIVARERYRTPKTYADAFLVLVEQGILPKEKEAIYIKMAMFRNNIVHLYHEVDDKDIYRILQEDLEDFRTFVRSVLGKVT